MLPHARGPLPGTGPGVGSPQRGTKGRKLADGGGDRTGYVVKRWRWEERWFYAPGGPPSEAEEGNIWAESAVEAFRRRYGTHPHKATESLAVGAEYEDGGSLSHPNYRSLPLRSSRIGDEIVILTFEDDEGLCLFRLSVEPA